MNPSINLRFITIAMLLIITKGYAFDHTYEQYNKVLSATIYPTGVDYSEVANQRAALDAFLTEASEVSEAEYSTWTRDQQLAMWINLYNGLILKTIIERKPNQYQPVYAVAIKAPKNSVWHIKKVWDIRHDPVAGKPITLRSLENDIIREQFKEPLIHFGLNCASIGCPPLRNEAYTAEQLRGQLLEQTQQYLANTEAGLLWNSQSRTLSLSKIFKWYKADYIPNQLDGEITPVPQVKADEQRMIQFIIQHIDKERGEDIAKGKVTTKFLFYDWGLNSN